MKIKSSFLVSFLAAGLIMASFSCGKGGDNTQPGSDAGATDSVLLNLGNNIILPSYQNLQKSVNALDSAVAAFNNGPSGSGLAGLQDLFKKAYINWQFTSEFNYFGPAQQVQPAITSLNIFPVNSGLIDQNIANGNFNINTFSNTTAKGFGALDYLLFSTGSSTSSLLALFTTDPSASNRKQYLAAVSADIKTVITTVVNGWLPSGGNYIQTFIDGKGNDLASSLGLLMNSSEQDFEILKNNRLGIPLGRIPVGANLPLAPEEVEAYYGGFSNDLAIAQLKAVRELYFGDSQNGNGKGLISYLITAENKNPNLKYHGGLLSDTIKANFDKAANYLNNIPNPLSANLSNANTIGAFNTCQLLVTLTKTDMTSAIGVLINYGDNDGD